VVFMMSRHNWRRSGPAGPRSYNWTPKNQASHCPRHSDRSRAKRGYAALRTPPGAGVRPRCRPGSRGRSGSSRRGVSSAAVAPRHLLQEAAPQSTLQRVPFLSPSSWPLGSSPLLRLLASNKDAPRRGGPLMFSTLPQPFRQVRVGGRLARVASVCRWQGLLTSGSP